MVVNRVRNSSIASSIALFVCNLFDRYCLIIKIFNLKQQAIKNLDFIVFYLKLNRAFKRQIAQFSVNSFK